MTKRNPPQHPGTRRTKSERSKALAAVFKRAGFTRKGADWYLEQGDLLWNTSLDAYRHPWEDEIPFDVHVNARYLPAQAPEDEYVYVVNGSMGPLPGAHSDPAFNNAYHEYDIEELDPLIRDAEELLVPLIKRMQTLPDILDAHLKGELSWSGILESARISWVYSTARKLHSPAYAALTQAMVDAGRWTREDCIVLEEAGMTVPPEARIPEGRFAWFRRRIREFRDQ